MEGQVTPVQVMKEIDRLFGKLKENGFSNIDLLVKRNVRVIEDKVAITWTLETNKGLKVAQYTKVYEEPVAKLKQQALERKQAIQSTIQKELDEMDEIIAVE